MKKYWKRKIPAVIATAVLGILVFSGLVMLLWNGILPSVLHVSSISIWQAMGLIVLARILFGGRKGRGYTGRCGDRRYMKWQGNTNCRQEAATAAE